eukprot:TRINITY_DN17992_c0_g1_i1.p1 TRINITY_DN17992_c0_g1~~TRINITY_DN17992_c0_g1_i1.p1  ORF type:complete len:674 (-),score=183.27 TRINITY_DN17992_c0_g1_i1:151-2172(-)
MSRQALPRLLADPSDVNTQKILLAAKLVGLELSLEASSVAVPELCKGQRTVRHVSAILRYIGTLFEDNRLYGNSFMEEAQVDSWIEWSCMELVGSNPPCLTQAVENMERHLEQRVFLVGQRLTLADIAVSVSLYHLKEQGALKALPKATARWLGTCTAQAAVQEVVVKGVGAAPVAAGGAGSSGGSLVKPYSSVVGGRCALSTILLAPDKGASLIGKRLTVCGWVRTKREGAKGSLAFVQLNDGSCGPSLQIVIDSSANGFESTKTNCGTGASLKCTGTLVKSEGKGQVVEMLLKEQDEVCVLGYCDGKGYPLAKKEHSMEFLREIAHLRPRTGVIGAVARVRSALAYATHEFFNSNGFLYVHTPLITAADCEGAGEMFQVTTMMENIEKKGLPKGKDGKTDYTEDFFGKPAFLTVSGQLSVENYCCALSSVYTFGPTFRAENSHTSRHLAEFWMIEPEIAFADIWDDMQCAEDYMKYCVQYVMDNHLSDLEFFNERTPGLIDRLNNLLAAPFGRVSYTEAIEILIKESPKAKFQEPVEWGMDLASEHERWLVEKVTKKPTAVYNYPKAIKAFYMRLNEDEKTVAAMDVLVPGIGEVIGGSQREERLDVLDRRLKEMDLEPKDYWWYRDLRKYGSVPHAGFGLGFERLNMLVTGIENIRDLIPYPRYPGHADF